MQLRTPKVYRERRKYENSQYRKLFRFTEENVEWIANHFLADLIHDPFGRGGAISKKTKMEIFLRYLADPGFQQGVAVDCGVSQSVVSAVVAEVLTKVCEKADAWIHFPTTEDEIAEARRQFQMPTVIGAIDCTHIQILKPSRHGDSYINRKGYASINVQATCDGFLRFTSVKASWPGSVHDSRIWRTSSLSKFMIKNRYGISLLGDEGYANRKWLLTPYKNPTTPHEIEYNRVHKRERSKIERCFGLLKRRFPMLQYMVRIKLDRVCRFILSAFVLHNVAKHVQDPDFDEEMEPENQPNAVPENFQQENEVADRAEGVATRNAIAVSLCN